MTTGRVALKFGCRAGARGIASRALWGTAGTARDQGRGAPGGQLPALGVPMTLPDLDTELNAERRHLTESRAALRRMRERAEAMYGIGADIAGDAYSAETLGTTMRR